jgi:pimeloyl-ACP methyl ester carboxylesterase
VQSVRKAGHMLQSLVDGEKNFDIISFDPRGVAFSTPSSHCFGDYLSDEIWELKKRMFGLLDTGPEAMKMQFAAERGRAALCAEAGSYDDGDGNIRAYMTTAYVARDMLEIVKKNKVVEDADSPRGHGTTHADRQQTVLQGNRKAQLQYIGVSYGTFLGNTFASMYPEHVGKMLLDGNVDAVDWGRKWFTTGLSDFEEGWSTFFERCFSVGKTCPLFRPSDTGPADIRSRVDSVLEQIKQDPIPLTSHGSSELITYSDIKLSIFSANYNPVPAFPALATVLNAIYTHNSTHTSLPARLVNPNPSISCFKNASSWPSQVQHSFSRDATFSTLCTDASSLASTPLSEFQSYFRNVSSQSPIAGPVLAEWKLPCMVWPRSLESKWRFIGPFGTNDSANDDSTAGSPILFLNNRLDPVCPIRNAHNMARKYKGSVVLEQDAVGHCALTAGLGPCVMGHVNRYFNQGALPEAGTVCPGGCRPFDEGCAAVAEEGGIRLWGDEGIW